MEIKKPINTKGVVKTTKNKNESILNLLGLKINGKEKLSGKTIKIRTNRSGKKPTTELPYISLNLIIFTIIIFT